MILTCINQSQIIGQVTGSWRQVVNKETKALSGRAAVLSECPLLLLDVI